MVQEKDARVPGIVWVGRGWSGSVRYRDGLRVAGLGNDGKCQDPTQSKDKEGASKSHHSHTSGGKVKGSGREASPVLTSVRQILLSIVACLGAISAQDTKRWTGGIQRGMRDLSEFGQHYH